MFDRILKRIRDKILAREYIMTLHAEEEMTDDGYTIMDVEHGVLTGEIVERQRDSATGESKYIVQGRSAAGEPLCVAVKLSPTGKLVVITVYAMEE